MPEEKGRSAPAGTPTGTSLGTPMSTIEMDGIKNWTLTEDSESIVWLSLDKAGSSTNVLSKEVLEELGEIIGRLSKKPPRGLIIRSAKEKGFIAGADIKEFTELRDHKEAEELIRGGQRVFDALEGLRFPTIALINGFCLGGGLELALACTYRVASDDRGTRFGAPEVNLGIHPGFGGTVRLPRLVGVTASMDMILTGRTIDARRAGRIGLVDYVEPLRHLEDRAKALVGERPRLHRLSLKEKVLSHRFVRPLLQRYLHSEVSKKAPAEHYPAPHSVIDIWAEYYDDPGVMYREEAKSVADLITGTTSKNLVRLFFLRESLKGLGKEVDFPVSHVHVVGAGVMGGDIASWCVLRGLSVTLQDREGKYIAPAMKRAYRLFKKKLKSDILVTEAMDRLMPDVGGAIGVEKADVVIEAIFEDLEAKQALYKELEPRMKKGALLATNTSSITLESLSEGLEEPSRLVGLHFFNPVSKMLLVEIVKGDSTDLEVVSQASAFAVHLDRLPLPVRSRPAFLVNRLLMPYLLEAVTMVEEGISPRDIDKVAFKFGMPMGPISLADTVGLDICLHVGEIMSESLGFDVPRRLSEMVKKGDLGKKSGKGFYDYGRYRKGRVKFGKRPIGNVATDDICDRLILSILNEAVAVLREGVVDTPDLLDGGMVFGTGFAPFRGGPMRHLSVIGKDFVIRRLEEFEGRYGKRFSPDSGWESLELPVDDRLP